MSNRRRLGFVAAAIAVGSGVGLLLLRDGGGGEEALVPPLQRNTVSVHATMEPRTHLFYEPVTAGLDLVLDRRVVRPGTIQVTEGFAPYVVQTRSVERTDSGNLVRLRYRWHLACVTAACLPREGSSTMFDFSLGRLDYVVVGQGRSAQPVDWPSVSATARVGPRDVEDALWRANTSRPPEVTYRTTPGVLAAGLFGAAVLLLVGAGLLVRQARPRRGAETLVEVEAERRSAIERALELALAASENGVGTAEQRKALERLARELGAEGLGRLAKRTRALAWSPLPPSRADVQLLAEDLRRGAGSER